MRDIHEIIAEHEAVERRLLGNPGERLSDLVELEVQQVESAEESEQEDDDDASDGQTGMDDAPVPEINDPPPLPDSESEWQAATEAEEETEDEDVPQPVLGQDDAEDVELDAGSVTELDEDSAELPTSFETEFEEQEEFDLDNSFVSEEESAGNDETVQAPDETDDDEPMPELPWGETEPVVTFQSLSESKVDWERAEDDPGFQGFTQSPPMTQSQLDATDLTDPSLTYEQRAEKQYAYGQKISESIAEDLAREISPMFSELRQHASDTVHNYTQEQTLLATMLRPR